MDAVGGPAENNTKPRDGFRVTFWRAPKKAVKPLVLNSSRKGSFYDSVFGARVFDLGPSWHPQCVIGGKLWPDREAPLAGPSLSL